MNEVEQKRNEDTVSSERNSGNGGSITVEMADIDPDELPHPLLDRDSLFEMLANRRRRYILTYLLNHPNHSAEVREIANQVTAWERDQPPETLTYDERKSAHISIYQHHAPKMADAGLITYDKDTKLLTLTDAATDLEEHQLLYTDDESKALQWWTLPLILMSAGTILLGIDALALHPGALSPLGWIALGIVITGCLIVGSRWIVS